MRSSAGSVAENDLQAPGSPSYFEMRYALATSGNSHTTMIFETWAMTNE